MGKKSLFLMFGCLFLGTSIKAQVGIGTESPDPHAMLDVASTNKGVLLPRVTLTSAAMDLDGDASTVQPKGLMVYNAGGTLTEGYYYWTGSNWAPVGGASAAANSWNIAGTTDPATSNTHNIYQSGQVTIGTDVLDAGAALNVVATNKGVLLPRVTLTGDKDKTTIPNPTTGMMAYNTGANAGLSYAGYVYWNGVEWRALTSSPTTAPDATLSCGQAYLDPEQVIRGGTPIVDGTVLKIPYKLGNGGMYNAATIKSTDPASTVQAVISNGQFENGSGILSFYVSGTPSTAETTPAGVAFDLTPFYAANPTITPGCTVIKIGQEIKADIYEVATMDNLKFTDDSGVKGYATNLTTPDGKFTVRAFIVSNEFNSSSGAFGLDSEYGMNLQVRNNTNENVTIAGQFNWHWGGSGGNGTNKLILQPGLWSGDSETASVATALYANYVSDTRGTGWAARVTPPTATNSQNRGHFVNWGNQGVNAGGVPERRVYSWTINDGATTKTAYVLTFSTSVLDNVVANTANCPGGICGGTKVFMMIQQITAP